MNIRKFALATLLTSASALTAVAQSDSGTMEADEMGIVNPDNGGPIRSDMATDNVYDGDMYETDGQTVMNMGGQVREDVETSIETDERAGMTEAEQLSTQEIIAEAEKGAPVTSSDDVVIGTVAYSQEVSNGYRVFVSVDPETQIPANMIAFDTSTLEVKTVGDGLEYASSLADLREAVQDRI